MNEYWLKKSTSTLLAMSVLLSGTAPRLGWSAEPETSALTIEQAVEEGVRSNLDLLAAQYNIPLAEADTLTAGLWNNPTIQVDTVFQPFGGNWNQTSAGGPREYDLLLSYPMDLSGKHSAATRSAGAATEIAKSGLQDAIRQKIRDARLMSQAEHQVLALMRADSAAQVEGMAYALARDQQILEDYTALMALAVKTRDQLQALETQGQMPEGSTDHLNAVINTMALDMSGLVLIIHEDRIALAQAMGFQNPEAVLELALDSETTPIDQAHPIDTDPTTTQAVERSYELAQMDQLIVLAANQKRELYFNWLDPAGDYTAALGFGLGETIAVARSRIQELRIKREQIQSAVAQKIAEAVAEYNEGLTTYGLAQNGITLSARRMTRVLAQIGPGSNLNTLDVEGIFQDSLSAAIRSEAMLAAFRVARSRIDRSLLQGQYVVLTHAPTGTLL